MCWIRPVAKHARAEFGSRPGLKHRSSVRVCNKFTFVVPGVLKQAGAAGCLLSVYLVLQHVLQQPVSALLPISVVQWCPFPPAIIEMLTLPPGRSSDTGHT